MALNRMMKKSTRSNTDGACVRAGYADPDCRTVAIDDSKNPGPQLVVSVAAFGDLLDRIKEGELS